MVTLRTLTKKSKLKLGNRVYSDLTVQRIIELKGKRNRFIPNLYFNNSKISFNDEVLNEFGITEKYKIEKPGTNLDTYLKFIEDKNLPQHSRLGYSKAIGKREIITKGKLQSINQSN